MKTKKYKNEDLSIFEVLKNSRKTKIELTYLEKIDKIGKEVVKEVLKQGGSDGY